MAGDIFAAGRRCAVALVKLQLNPAAAKFWPAGSAPALYVSHQHVVPLVVYKLESRHFAYAVHLTSPGQSEVVFASVIVASAHNDNAYNHLETEGRIPVRFAQWPKVNVGDPLQPWGKVQPLDCIFSISFGQAAITCPGL
ncbi:MAG: hypothetical protein HY703_02835 [Gemmatimonadetes bacterium]|nr:hypothetical protein [Gemmatimonadota bacterium]